MVAAKAVKQQSFESPISLGSCSGLLAFLFSALVTCGQSWIHYIKLVTSKKRGRVRNC